MAYANDPNDPESWWDQQPGLGATPAPSAPVTHAPEMGWEDYQGSGTQYGQPVPPANYRSSAPAGYAGPKDFPSLVKYWQSSHPASAPDMPGLLAFLNANGIAASTATHNGMASDDKVLWNGQTYDLGSSLGSGEGRWFTDFSPMGADGGNQGGFTGASLLQGSLVEPYMGRFQPPAGQAPYQKPPAFDFPNFTPPTGDSILKDPSLQFRLDLGRKAIEGDRAAKGLYRTGATAKGLEDYAQNLASTEYGNIYNRDASTYTMNRGNALDKYNTNYGTQYVDPYNFQTQAGDKTYDRAYQQFLSDYTISTQNQDRAFDKYSRTAQLGLNAT